jgi:hypothetical protein
VLPGELGFIALKVIAIFVGFEVPKNPDKRISKGEVVICKVSNSLTSSNP